MTLRSLLRSSALPAAALAFVFGACAGDLATPESTFNTFIRIINESSADSSNAASGGILSPEALSRHFARVRGLLSTEFLNRKPGNGQFADVMAMYWTYGMYAGSTRFGRITGVEVRGVRYEGEGRAVVSALIRTNNPDIPAAEIEMDMVEEDGEWRIVPVGPGRSGHCVRRFYPIRRRQGASSD